MAEWEKHVKWFGSPQKYAEAIKQKEASKQELSDPGAAAAFKQAHPEYFGGSSPATKTVTGGGSPSGGGGGGSDKTYYVGASGLPGTPTGEYVDGYPVLDVGDYYDVPGIGLTPKPGSGKTISEAVRETGRLFTGTSSLADAVERRATQPPENVWTEKPATKPLEDIWRPPPPPPPQTVQQPPGVEAAPKVEGVSAVEPPAPQPERLPEGVRRGVGGFEYAITPTVRLPDEEELFRIYREVFGPQTEERYVRHFLTSPQFRRVLQGAVPFYMAADPLWQQYLRRLGVLNEAVGRRLGQETAT